MLLARIHALVGQPAASTPSNIMTRASARHILVDSEEKCLEIKAEIAAQAALLIRRGVHLQKAAIEHVIGRAFDAAVATILAACKEFNKSCGYPANNPAEVEALMEDGWDFLIMQRRNQDAFDAVLTARRLSGRAIQSP